MTTSLKILILTLVMLTGSAYGQSKFLKICEDQQSPQRHEMKWLKMFFKVESCREVAEKISKLQSYNEFFLHSMTIQHRQEHSWMKAFPHIYGIKDSMSVEKVPWYKLGPGFNFGNFFKDPEIYSEFKNLKMLDLSLLIDKKPCELLKALPHIETVLADRLAMLELKKCKPYSQLPEVISIGDYVSADSNMELNQKIIGIEYMVGISGNLNQYPNLRYLGLSFPFKDEFYYHSLIQNQNITHLSLNSSESLQYAYVLGELSNLSFLAISCITSFRDIYANPSMVEDFPEYCSNAGLKNVNFLKNLPFLEEIILDFEGLEDISALKEMPQLKTVSHPMVPGYFD